MSTLEKIMIVGVPGVGKTTLSKILSTELDLPVFHVDDRFIINSGNYIPTEEMEEIALDLCAREKWIIDGTYRIVARSVINEADLVVLIDMGRIKNIKNIILRRAKSHFRSRNQNPEGKKKKIQLGLITRPLTITKHVLANRKSGYEEWYEIINSCISPSKLVRITKINKRTIKLIMNAVMCMDNE